MEEVRNSADIIATDCPSDEGNLTADALIPKIDSHIRSGEFSEAMKLIKSILEKEPGNCSALKRKLLCDLKIKSIEEIQTISYNKLSELDIESYINSAPEESKSYFSDLVRYKELRSEINTTSRECDDLRNKIQPKYKALDDVSRKEARRELFSWDYGENASYPTILGPIFFVVVLLIYVYYCSTHNNSQSSEIIMGCVVLFIPALLSVPAIRDIIRLLTAPRMEKEIEKKYSDFDSSLKSKTEMIKVKESEADVLFNKICGV
ncbi:MAG: hypothetical protein J6U23_09605 [Clostridiales bacterium]|nr:hypothetical protein [Clostridiales bacterium]